MNCHLLKKQDIARSFNKAANHYHRAAELHRQVGTQLQKRLPLLNHPTTLLEIGSGTGYFTQLLFQHYQVSSSPVLIALDLAEQMLRIAKYESHAINFAANWTCGDVDALPISKQCVDLITSNLSFQWCFNLDQTLGECYRILKKSGYLVFSTLGPESLYELRYSWKTVDNYTHVNPFFDQKTWEYHLIKNGFKILQSEVEYTTFYFQSVYSLMKQLKMMGAQNIHPDKPNSLTGKNKFQRAIRAFEQFRENGKLPLKFEVIYFVAKIKD